MSKLDKARDHLGAALIQALPSDDAVIMGHVRDAHALIKDSARELRMARAALEWAELHAERALRGGPDEWRAFCEQMATSGELKRKMEEVA